MRIQKYLSEQGVMSRRAAEAAMRAGKVAVNGEIVRDLGRQIEPLRDKVEVKGVATGETVLINKPRGIVSSRVLREGRTIYQEFPHYAHLHVAGRLDKESEGLLVLTDDGVIAKQLTGAAHPVEKEYHVTVRENLRGSELAAMARGVRLKDGMTLPATVTKLDAHSFSIVLREGKNHQIRRMADKARLTVTRLVRARIGPLTLQGLKPGAARTLSKEETMALRQL